MSRPIEYVEHCPFCKHRAHDVGEIDKHILKVHGKFKAMAAKLTRAADALLRLK